MSQPANSETVTKASAEAAALLEESIASVRQALSGLRFGQVAITVHEGRVVQIDVTEKKRLRPN
jgi:hypothetical protein